MVFKNRTILQVLFLLFLVFPIISFAADSFVNLNSIKYHLLAPLPFVTTPGTKDVTTPFLYISQILKLVIAIAGVAAVLRIIVGGFKYVSAEGFGQKSNAKETITNALLGLLLAIGSYSILYTLNDKLVNLNLSLDSLPVSPPPSTDLGSGPALPPDNLGKLWPSDSQERDQLTAAGIEINNPNCKTEGVKEPPCTSLYGINPVVLTTLIKVKETCKCNIVVTGGTEYWFHSAQTQHRPGGSVADLRLSTNFSDWLRKNGTPASGSTECSRGFERYRYNGALYVNEQIDNNDPHWHVCF